MDFLDSLDLDVSNKKSRRVRSWYLYEQLKSLERNQVDAAQKLKDRSFQDKILRQELFERKVRRKVYDQFGLCRSDSRIQRSVKSDRGKSTISSTADLFEGFRELPDDEGLTAATDLDLSDACSQDISSQGDKYYEDDFKSIIDSRNDNSDVASANSVVNIKSENTVTEDKDLNYNEEEKINKFDDINNKFDDIRENLICLEKLTQADDDNTYLLTDSRFSNFDKKSSKQISMKDKNVNTHENNIYVMWSKLVSFAYQIIQLNHGNCYYDYGSQFLTAVLACDVLRRGINRMCHILQPYVSPIKFAIDTELPAYNNSNVKRKKSLPLKTARKTYDYKILSPYLSKRRLNTSRKYRSESCWEQRSPNSMAHKISDRKDRATEPLRSVPKMSVNKGSSTLKCSSFSSIWPYFSNEDSLKSITKDICKCGCHKVLNPMLELSRYLDIIMKDTDDSLFINC